MMQIVKQQVTDMQGAKFFLIWDAVAELYRIEALSNTENTN